MGGKSQRQNVSRGAGDACSDVPFLKAWSASEIKYVHRGTGAWPRPQFTQWRHGTRLAVPAASFPLGVREQWLFGGLLCRCTDGAKWHPEPAFPT